MAAEHSIPNVHITTNEDSEAKTSSFLPLTPPPTQPLGPSSSLSYIYSTPPSFTVAHNADLTHHLTTTSSGPPYKFFPIAGGTAIGYLNFEPNPEQEEGFWHRTQTVDYIVLLEGEMELSLDGGEKRVIKRGEVVVQRAVMHKWKNLSRTEEARFLVVSLGAEGAVEGAMEFGGEK
jgi:quercetin dioxygenase-like cupin family protein